MATTPNLGLTLLDENQRGAEIPVNESMLVFDLIIGGGQLIEATAPPPSPTNGDARLVVPTATGVFTGQEGMTAYYWNGTWKFYDLPLPDHWSTTVEVRTGRYEDGENIYKKSFVIPAGPVGGAPPNDIVNTPHGIATIKLTKPLWLKVSLSDGNLTQVNTSGWTDETLANIGYSFFVTATNIVWRTNLAFNLAAYSARVILEYAR